MVKPTSWDKEPFVFSGVACVIARQKTLILPLQVHVL